MDIPRESQARKRRNRRIAFGAIAIVAVAVITVGLSRLEPAAPGVDSGTLWMDNVKRGPMIRQVRGSGTLVPEEIRWIPALTQGRVEKILALPGTIVKPDTVLLELSNQEVEVAALEAEQELKGAEAEMANLRVQLEGDLLARQAAAATVQAEHHQAKLQAEADAELARDGLIAALTLKLSQVRADELAGRAEIEKKRLDISADAARAQIAVQQARVDSRRATYRLRRDQLDALRVRAGAEGVLQQVPVEVGQQVTPGANLARVAEPGRLKAEVRIGETQARDVQIGQIASIDTRNGVIPGRVTRIDPAVENGTVTVDVALEGELPRGARPDLSVDGTIELERLDEVLFVGRPAFGQEHSTVGLFRLVDSGSHAVRVQVKLGRSSVNTVEILEGLSEGDRVILSDMSAWDAFDRVRLE
ncbi:MAG TPA: HlyD family efflux transporter periplasmic adaptor subunit [Candidatus Polarisedimenticolia bacterium]|nr:HlyD family efflux transporter periplasmic adaptor subunit [Candidatus Polarisedimenticolia bacterium]